MLLAVLATNGQAQGTKRLDPEVACSEDRCGSLHVNLGIVNQPRSSPWEPCQPIQQRLGDGLPSGTQRLTRHGLHRIRNIETSRIVEDTHVYKDVRETLYTKSVDVAKGALRW
jgi:hypothetical protein